MPRLNWFDPTDPDHRIALAAMAGVGILVVVALIVLAHRVFA